MGCNDDWDFNDIAEQVELAEEYRDEYDDRTEKCVYLGSVFNITPSGKYYTFWARGNVDDVEAEADERFWECMESHLDDFGLYLKSGEGDPTDVFVCKFVEWRE